MQFESFHLSVEDGKVQCFVSLFVPLGLEHEYQTGAHFKSHIVVFSAFSRG